MNLPDPARTALAWLATYLLHSTLLLTAAWLIARRLRSIRLRELCWRAAIFGGVLSVSAQFALDVVPFAGRIDLAHEAVVPAEMAARPGPPLALPAVFEPGPAPPPAEPALGWASLALGAWVVGSTATVLLLMLALGRLRALLSGRQRVESGVLVELLDELRGPGVPRGVRLYTSSKVDGPLALGAWRPTIVVPERALTELPRPQLRAMLAHELAHLARRDPQWLDLVRSVETLLFFQPLNRLASRELRACSELLCDAWAVDRTGDRVALARCLTEVADWLAPERAALPVCGMASPRSPLRARVENILSGPAESERAFEPAAPLSVLVVGLMAWTAPSFAAGRAPSPASDSNAVAAQPEVRTLLNSPANPRVAPLQAAVDELAEALNQLGAELRQVRAEFAGQELPAPLAARLEQTSKTFDELQSRSRMIRSWLTRWQGSAPSNRVAPDATQQEEGSETRQ